MARPRVQLGIESDFRGGLNLRRDAFMLQANESPDLLNVNVDPRGGVTLRDGASPYDTDLPGGPIVRLAPYESATQNSVIAQLDDGTIRRLHGGVWDGIGGAPVVFAGPLRTTTFKDNLYLMDGVASARRYNGTTNTVLTQAWNNNLDSPTLGNMPIAAVTAVWQGCVFVANTLESATAYKNRIRWSHPNHPESFREIDFFDLDTGHDGDHITALVPYGDRLLVFKQKSMHTLYGVPPDGFRAYPISQDLGVLSQEQVVSTDQGVFFFAWPEGVFVFRGDSPKYLFERLQPAVTDGLISSPSSIRLAWSRRRLWVSCVYEGDRRSFVLDPSISKEGAWVLYDLTAVAMLAWEPAGSTPELLGAVEDTEALMSLERVNQSFDNFGGADLPIAAHYRTRWFDLGVPKVKKRWKRPEAVLKGGTSATIGVDVYHDYDPTHAKRRFTFDSDSASTAGVWNTSTWDNAVWGRRSGTRNVVDKGPGLGTSRAVGFLFTGPVSTADWGIDSLTVAYVARPVRA